LSYGPKTKVEIFENVLNDFDFHASSRTVKHICFGNFSRFRPFSNALKFFNLSIFAVTQMFGIPLKTGENNSEIDTDIFKERWFRRRAKHTDSDRSRSYYCGAHARGRLRWWGFICKHSVKIKNVRAKMR